MRLILTHEQADFDALAGLLGAFMVSEDSLAALPRTMNRNVQSFLNLYNADLPFTFPDDLPRNLIDSVTLVDTQSLVTHKGLHEGTRVTAIDHHQKRSDTPPDWEVVEIKTGAITTYFVQLLQEQGSHLSIIEATLLLLGIYEDTGSLTFANTTPMDARAAAYLLEEGASLRIATEFLNPPLSSQQRSLLDQLLKNSKTLHVHDQNITISTGDAEELTEEISTIAHKLSDLLDPDALFIFVNTREGIRLVARSVSDQVNVAKIAANYGGGGHERAAAALIHPPSGKDKKDFFNQLIKKFQRDLPKLVVPTTTVGQIMSKQPLTIHPDTSAKEALQLMQQFGYEGYPVVKNKTVIGLLTRRAVDRALAHKLNLPAISLMEAGCVTVLPSDSLEKLQYLMASTGWGQVPVVDSHTQEIIGIVTRTDLLKTLAGNNGYTEKTNITADLEEALPPAKLGLIKLIATHAAEKNLPIYLVGGFVRDILLKRVSPDVDFVVEGDAIALARSLATRYGGKITSHRQFGTAKWQIAGIRDYLIKSSPHKTVMDPADLPPSVDLISARTEFYSYPTAMPTVKRGSIKLDLQRRDFSINTMAVRLDGTHFGDLYDFWGGLLDLKKGLIRVLHSLSFVDDPTRMLRAVRFEKRLNFAIEERTLQLLNEARPLLEQVSGDRIRHELDLILNGNLSAEILSRLEELELLKLIHVEIKWRPNLIKPLEKVLNQPLDDKWDLPTSVGKIPTRRFMAYLVLLSQVSLNQINIVAKRLHLSASLKSALIQSSSIFSFLHQIPSWKPSKVARRFEKIPLVVLYVLFQLAPNEDSKKIIEQYIFKWRLIKIHTNGEKLRALDIQPGPTYQKVLTALRSAWLDGEIRTRKDEDRLLKELLLKYKSE